MQEQSKFDNYAIRYNTDLNKEQNPLAEIICLTRDKTVALIRFWKDKVPLSEYKVEKTISHEKIFHINFDISRFNDIIQMLQYGKPVIVEYDDSTKLGVLLLETVHLQKGQK